MYVCTVRAHPNEMCYCLMYLQLQRLIANLAINAEAGQSLAHNSDYVELLLNVIGMYRYVQYTLCTTLTGIMYVSEMTSHFILFAIGEVPLGTLLYSISIRKLAW